MAIKVEMSRISTILNRLFKTSIKKDSVSESQDNDYGDMCRRIMQYDGSYREKLSDTWKIY
ncbi:MAG: hypothetical protein WAQ29_04225 [Nitrososphaeraceae archaeon]